MDYTLEDKNNIIKNILRANNLTPNDLSQLFSKRMTSTSEIRRKRTADGISYEHIASFFSPSIEEIDIKDIEGLEYRTNSFYDCLVNIYRPESIFENLGKFDIQKFYKTVNDSNFMLIEDNGKYYVHGDGNHRSLLMLFQYYLGLAKLQKRNAPTWYVKDYINRSKIKVPVIHLNHKDNLLKFLNDNTSDIFDDFEQDYIGTFLEGQKYKSISYDKKSNTYSIYYKGFKRQGLSSDEALDLMEDIESIKCKNNIFYNYDSFILFNNHFGLVDVPRNDVMRCDEIISKFHLPRTTFQYFIDGAYYGEKFDLHIGNSIYTENIKNIGEINNFIEKNLDVLKADCVEDIYEPANSLYERKYENITLEEAITIVNVLKELEDLILVNEVRKNISKK